MLPLQRKQALLNYISEHGAATMKELSDHFGVSEMTIRRDLNVLEKEKHVLRSHGGVVYRDSPSAEEEPDLVSKQAHNQDIKDRLAAYVAERFVRDGDVLILENGTTVSRIAELLGSFDQLTLLTNGMETLSRFRPLVSERNTIICCGGILREVSGTFVGPVAEEFFERYHADTLFLSALGYLSEEGFTDPNLLDTQVKKAMIRSAKKVVMVLDSSKIGKRFFSTVAHLADIDVLVTDQGIRDEDKILIEESNVELHII
ncbi:DeoR/GlpR family DNA-binding transcription regulator [Paenibacillus aceris]|uniref:DeoR/GlpR family transcriptional regulator of sugar metabolism n=1 Tax=Paenibacillus aceris TaxID=869555 RepID=A0ABS4I359_9BACL|nr:DeoR/GlpR family DNA-binding transcription regulator [Paenibacillus aceris]MBP1965338.1 DeoR/GlpR family transcriptional regulator of sugar metabolism [Paenibacillus aceris]NHW36018.1 DeoR/GlpR transcriptional regulator [Paenibacillus aceris]